MSIQNLEQEKQAYLDLLDGCHAEQKYQDFLENHTRFIPREFVQNHGVHFSLAVRKLGFGADYKSDFFYFSKSSDDWNAVFIEIEKPSSRFFKANSNEPHGDFTKAVNQIKQWKAWLSVSANSEAFLSSMKMVQVPSHMATNPTFFKYVLVLGRRDEYQGNQTRRRLVQSYEEDDFKIISFDSLAEGLSGKHPLYLGVRHNEFIDVFGNEIVDGSLFSWMEPTEIRVSADIHAKLRQGSVAPKQLKMVNGKSIDAWVAAAETIKVR